MGEPPADALFSGLVLGVGALSRRHTKVCVVCKKYILPGDGYRTTAAGHTHGACVNQEGKDAQQGPPPPAGDRGGVCPEG